MPPPLPHVPGKIIALGTPSSLKGSFTAHTLLYLDTSSPLESMRAIEGLEGVLDVAVFGRGLHVRVTDTETASSCIRPALEGCGIGIRRLEPILPSMEDVFVAMIEEEERRSP